MTPAPRALATHEAASTPPAPRVETRCAARTAVAVLGAATLALGVQGMAPAPAQAVVNGYAPGTHVSYKNSQQVMVADRTSGTRGTWARYEWRGKSVGWVKVGTYAYAVFGKGGVVPAARRVHDTNTTPAGTFHILMAFGVGNPGTRLPYRRVLANSWWDERPHSSTYNRWIIGPHGCTRAHCEHLADYTNSMYRQAALIDYNYRAPVVREGGGSGAGIFLHYGRYHTAGCVGISTHTELNATIRWMNPAKHPTIVIKA